MGSPFFHQHIGGYLEQHVRYKEDHKCIVELQVRDTEIVFKTEKDGVGDIDAIST
jgi:hypothetical protein